MNFEADDLDWALGELLHLTWEAKCAGVLPHFEKPQLFHACLRVINSYPFEIRKAAWDLWQEMRPTEVNQSWGQRANARSR
jgi:hypothetical protein